MGEILGIVTFAGFFKNTSSFQTIRIKKFFMLIFQSERKMHKEV